MITGFLLVLVIYLLVQVHLCDLRLHILKEKVKELEKQTDALTVLANAQKHIKLEAN